MKPSPLFPALAATALTAALLLSAGCNSHDGPRDLMMEEATKGGTVERPVAMKGETSFLGGSVAAVATVTRGFDRGPGAQPMGRRPGSDGLFGRRKDADDAGAFAEVYNIGGDSEEEQKEAMKDYIRQAMARRAAGSPMPPVTLRVTFENKGPAPLELEVTEVNSDLGNFAVRPPKLTLAPGAKGSLEPMVSQLGVTSDEIPLKLALRSGGQKEAAVVLVRNVIKDSLRKEFERMQK